MSEPPTVGPARPDEREAALDLLFRDLPPADRVRQVAAAAELFRTGDFPADGLLVARGPNGPVGVLVCVPLPGAGASVWPPRAAPGHSVQEDALVRHAVGWLRERGVKLAQALLTPEESLLAGPLLRNGFAHVTHLWHLRHNLRTSPPPPPPPAPGQGLRFLRYDPDDREAFLTTLLRTYEGTLDCPEVNGVRTVEEIMAGHRAQGAAGRWWLASEGDRPAGVLLLNAPEGGAWEVAYVGVVPEMRRRGFGEALVHKALTEARRGAAAGVLLSVDARNRPAWGLYQRFGFEPFDRREVYLAVWH